MSREELRLRATVLAYFEIPWLGMGGADDAEAADLVFEDCERIAVAGDERHWALDDSVRRAVASRVPVAELRAARERVEQAPDGPQQWAIDELLSGRTLPPLNTLAPQRRRALESVTRWLGGTQGVPSHRDVRNQVRFDDFLVPLRAVSKDFVGRERVLAELAGPTLGRDRPVLVHGFGGVGKSALVARHLLQSLGHQGTVVSYLNFDHSAIEPDRPTSLVRAMAGQLALQLRGATGDAAERLAGTALDRRRTIGKGLEVQSRGLQLVQEDVSAILAELGRLLDGRPYALVMDTLEEVQRRPLVALESLLHFLYAVRDIVPHTQVVLAGRAPEPMLGADEVALAGLERPDALSLLRRLVGKSADVDLEWVIDRVGTNPLALHLAAELLRRTRATGALRALEVNRVGLEGVLYRRLLGHIPDPQVRRLALPSLALRRITPGVIRHVLARPCGVRVRHDYEAQALFRVLAREAMLVEPDPRDPSALVHRTDVRRMVLGLLSDDAPALLARAHRAAVRYYDGRPDPDSRTEAMYHRLMLGQQARTLNRYWSPDLLGGLQQSIDDLPPASKAYLAAKSPLLGVSDEDLRHAEAETKRRLLQRRVGDLVAEGRVAEALALVDQSGDESPAVANLRVQLLELTGQLLEAFHLAERHRERSARSSATGDFFRFNFHVSRLAERMADLARA